MLALFASSEQET